MKRLRTLGAAVVAALALSAGIGVASAAAAKFAAETYPYPVAIKGYNTNNSTFTVGGGIEVQCTLTVFEAEAEAASETMQAQPYFNKCKVPNYPGGSMTASVETNGCEYIFHAGAEVGDSGTFDIGGAECGGIKWTYPSCTVTIPPQTGIKKVDYTNQGSGTGRAIDIDVHGSGVKYIQTSLCYGGSGTFENGSYEAGWEARGENKAGNPVGLYVAQKPTLKAEAYPATITGQQKTAKELLLTTKDVTELNCETAQLSAEMSAAGTELSAGAEYDGCTAFFGGEKVYASVEMNSCRYVHHVDNAGPTYTGTMDVVCANEGDAIDFRVPLCTVKVPAQEGLTGVTLTNSGEGKGRQVDLSLGVKGVEYTQTKLCPSGKGTFTDGVLSGTFAMKAFSGKSQIGLFVFGEEI